MEGHDHITSYYTPKPNADGFLLHTPVFSFMLQRWKIVFHLLIPNSGSVFFAIATDTLQCRYNRQLCCWRWLAAGAERAHALEAKILTRALGVLAMSSWSCSHWIGPVQSCGVDFRHFFPGLAPTGFVLYNLADLTFCNIFRVLLPLDWTCNIRLSSVLLPFHLVSHAPLL